jgi:AmiR/NasT family two-component response regulator
MDRYHLTEEEAHRTLQKRSMDAGTRLPQAARQVLEELQPQGEEIGE